VAATRLGFDGINYRADIWLNGRRVASKVEVYGAFRTFDVDIIGAVRPGPNVLAVEVFPPQPGELTIGFVDWNPRPPDRNMGLWRPVTLRLSGPVSIEQPFVTSRVNLETLAEADLTITAETVNRTDQPVSGALLAELEGTLLSQEVKLDPGEKAVTFSPEQFQLGSGPRLVAPPPG
jgi:exo-1,4-beta-D-glucosaminidase